MLAGSSRSPAHRAEFRTSAITIAVVLLAFVIFRCGQATELLPVKLHGAAGSVQGSEDLVAGDHERSLGKAVGKRVAGLMLQGQRDKGGIHG